MCEEVRESEEGSELRSGLEKGGVVVMGVKWDHKSLLYFGRRAWWWGRCVWQEVRGD